MDDQIKLGADEEVEVLGNGLFRVIKKRKLNDNQDSESVASGSRTAIVQPGASNTQNNPVSDIKGY